MNIYDIVVISKTCVYFIVHGSTLKSHDLVTFLIEDGSNRLVENNETTKMVIKNKCKFAKYVLLKTPTVFMDSRHSNSSINILLCNLWEINEDEKNLKRNNKTFTIIL
jgi:hypothetical protein